jgi:hypothetical protein
VILRERDGLTFAQLDSARHDLVAVDLDPVTREPIFGSGAPAAFGAVEPVVGVEGLDAGLYDFTCSIHEWMVGQLEIINR